MAATECIEPWKRERRLAKAQSEHRIGGTEDGVVGVRRDAGPNDRQTDGW